ncbi:MAG: 5'/3'-nucleotidase SurE, partial [bacterium]|nr:5'/3'-nucleotidase SurE [bacterium]
MKILLTNDDGIFSEGLRIIYDKLKKIADIFVIVPEAEKSATSHSINLLSPIRVKKVNVNGLHCYIVSGTPVDCVKIGIKELVKEKIDMVVSGINP